MFNIIKFYSENMNSVYISYWTDFLPFLRFYIVTFLFLFLPLFCIMLFFPFCPFTSKNLLLFLLVIPLKSTPTGEVVGKLSHFKNHPNPLTLTLAPCPTGEVVIYRFFPDYTFYRASASFHLL